MTKQACFDAINRTAARLELSSWVYVTDKIHVPLAATNLAAVLWVKKTIENEDTALIREQILNIWYGKGVLFDD